MSDSIADLLKNRSYGEPDEAAAIKAFVSQKFNSSCKVTVQVHQIIIAVPSSALAGTLRMHLPKLHELVRKDTRLVIRTGY